MKMDYIEISAKTVDDAITEAIIKLGTTHDKIEYEVIEKGSAGFLGINRKDAVIRARRKNDTNDNIRDFLESVFKAMGPVSYTHLDVYKRQALLSSSSKKMSSIFGSYFKKSSSFPPEMR